ncbi:MAG: hypothetical protein EZS28_032298 [Streblomastix strix]|uniref:Uncharacterized protein n=1 Tax=Streblomastix strix TaxID=222440 RepID=A0A5J4UQW4_9EUKA|nr:MAG: hypothetical protein EZS28_032298 [Streblomastix strix]
MKDATALWGSAIYAREQAVISGNSLNDSYTKNNVSVSPLEIDRQAAAGTPFYYGIPNDITFSKNLNVDNKNNNNGQIDNANQYKTANIFYLTTLYSGSKAIKTLYPNKYMLAWKLATDDSFMRGYSSSKIAYPDPIKVSITPMMHYLCDAFVRIIFDDSSMLQVLNIDVIGELANGAIKPQ